ncbi:MAG: hypothetical protein HeimC3_16630 [Candidatus Heimdallarchaeota archaeon LC_3]|nr:MAG: hypothetical protein HeimC3_16630 [Candidatus Heimdallarchaeota archaeon LC_3]
MSQLVRSEKIIPKSDNWSNLCSLLDTMGVDTIHDRLIIKWDSPDTSQFEFLLILLGKFVANTLIGEYKNAFWEIRK